MKPESYWFSSLGPQIRMEGDFCTLFLILRVAGFGLCEIVLEPGSVRSPEICKVLTKTFFLAHQPLSYACVWHQEAEPLLFGNKN